MFDQLLKLVKENAGDAIINNPAIPNQQNDAAINTAASGIMDQLKKAVAGGGASQLTGLLKDNNIQNNPLVNGISSNVSKELMSKFGINESQAGSIVKQLIPVVMSKFVNKTNDPNDKSFDLNGIIGALSGNKGAGGLLSGLGKMFGGK